MWTSWGLIDGVGWSGRVLEGEWVKRRGHVYKICASIAASVLYYEMIQSISSDVLVDRKVTRYRVRSINTHPHSKM